MVSGTTVTLVTYEFLSCPPETIFGGDGLHDHPIHWVCTPSRLGLECRVAERPSDGFTREPSGPLRVRVWSTDRLELRQND